LTSRCWNFAKATSNFSTTTREPSPAASGCFRLRPYSPVSVLHGPRCDHGVERLGGGYARLARNHRVRPREWQYRHSGIDVAGHAHRTASHARRRCPGDGKHDGGSLVFHCRCVRRQDANDAALLRHGDHARAAGHRGGRLDRQGGTIVRLATVLLVGVALGAISSVAHAQKSSPVAPGFEYLGTMQVQTGTRTVVENGPQGTRTIVQIVSGRFEGPRLKAAVQIPAGDWITNRADGTYRLDVRLTLKTDDGALILVTYNGIGQTTPVGASLRAAPLFETGDQRYAWLTKLQAIAVGERVGTDVKYDVYALK